MQRRIIALMTLLGCALLVSVLRDASAQPTNPEGRPDEVLLTPASGPTTSAAGFDYVSEPTEAARPFTHLLLRREARVPEGAAVHLFLRASTDGASWSNWQEVGENHDLWQETDGPDVQWSETIDVGATARFWQVRGFYTPSPTGARPELRSIKVSTVDANSFGGPRQAAAESAPGLTATPKPAVVSRSAWGCPDGQGSRVSPAHYPVNHMVVHHTADSNSLYPSERDWAARVRAEWSFHTYTRGWGDVGYNYLIDPNGVVYEGRAGGDDAVAFHDRANYGSMGVVLIGTYSSVKPTNAAQDSLVRLLGWKAEQKRIDPLGRSFYYGCSIARDCYTKNQGSIVANIAGHRDVIPGQTTCPGDQAWDLLPDIRVRVKQLLEGAGGDNGDLEVDELEGGFSRSSANWYDAWCGAGGHSYFTYATDNPAESTNRATWAPNIPQTGTYRVLAHIPQGCGLASPPYATTQAKYRIRHAGGETVRTVDHNTSEEWVDLGVYTFNAGSGGAVSLDDLTGEPFSARKVVFFDSVKWVSEIGKTSVELQAVAFERKALASGELLKVSFTVKNTGDTVVHGQEPRLDPTAGGGLSGDANGYTYDEGECFAGDVNGSYPAYPKESGRFRVALGFDGWDASHPNCNAPVDQTTGKRTNDYPWRWGLNSDLAPGQSQTVVGYVRFRVPGGYTLRAGLVQEYVRYHAQGVGTATVTVTPERFAPHEATYSGELRPLAHVFQLGSIPDNFLARTANPLSIPRGAYVASFPWEGGTIDWGSGGPNGLSDQFLIEQTRTFVAPVSGRYTFRTTSDDGSWLWVNGQPVVINNGLHPAADAVGEIDLSPGVHVLSFKYFERTGTAVAGYSVRLPGDEIFSMPPDGLGSGAFRLGSTFADHPTLVISADDLGGSGISRIRWGWAGAPEQESPGGRLNIGKLQNGTYRLRYRAIDLAGNEGPQRELVFTVNTDLELHHTYQPLSNR